MVGQGRTLSCVRSVGDAAASAAFRRVGVVLPELTAAALAAAQRLRVRQAAGSVGRPVVTRRLAALPRRKLLILHTTSHPSPPEHL